MEIDMDMEAPLDFEFEEDPLLSSPAPTKKRSKDVGLDDLLKDFFKEKKKRNERESKRARSRKCYNSDEDEDTSHLSLLVNQCEQKMQEIGNEDEIPLWGLHVFGNQKTPPPPLSSLELCSCKIFQSVLNSELNLVLGLSSEKGESFFDGLLINGWLSKLVFMCGHVEEHLAVWTFNLMLYSSKEELRTSGCDFWCAILPSRDEVKQPSLKIDWFPSSVNLKQALELYGYQFDSSFDISSPPEVVHDDSVCHGPPQNIRCWIKFLTACCGVRVTWSIFSTLEAEEFLGVIISLFLDRQLQGLSSLLFECMMAIISCFEDQEWNISCSEVAKSLASRLPKDLNCLRVVECISGVDTRSKQLRSEVAFQILVNCLDGKLTDAEEILSWLMSINMRDKSCDYFKVYIYLSLAANWLFSNPLLEEKPVTLEMWGAFLRNCSCQITYRDLSSYASKVRNKASYILQSTIQ